MRDWIGLIQFPMIALMFAKTYDLGLFSLVGSLLFLVVITFIDMKWLMKWELDYSTRKNPILNKILEEVERR